MPEARRGGKKGRKIGRNLAKCKRYRSVHKIPEGARRIHGRRTLPNGVLASGMVLKGFKELSRDDGHAAHTKREQVQQMESDAKLRRYNVPEERDKAIKMLQDSRRLRA